MSGLFNAPLASIICGSLNIVHLCDFARSMISSTILLCLLILMSFVATQAPDMWLIVSQALPHFLHSASRRFLPRCMVSLVGITLHLSCRAAMYLLSFHFSWCVIHLFPMFSFS
ncbi:hypothetical protein FKM82_025864 [Ascaphus truei]